MYSPWDSNSVPAPIEKIELSESKIDAVDTEIKEIDDVITTYDSSTKKDTESVVVERSTVFPTVGTSVEATTGGSNDNNFVICGSDSITVFISEVFMV